jgi:hypothetical protein
MGKIADLFGWKLDRNHPNFEDKCCGFVAVLINDTLFFG